MRVEVCGRDNGRVGIEGGDSALARVKARESRLLGWRLFPAGERLGPLAFRRSEHIEPPLFYQGGGRILVELCEVFDQHRTAVLPVAGIYGASPALHAAEIVITECGFRFGIH